MDATETRQVKLSNLRKFSKRVMRDIDVAGPEDRAVLIHVWLGFNVARELTGAAPVAQLTQHLKLVNPRVNRRIVEDCLNTAGDDPGWKEVLDYYDDETRAVFPPPALVSSLVGLVNDPANRVAAGAIDKIASQLGVPTDIVALVAGWRSGAANEERLQTFEELKAKWAESSGTAAAILRHLRRRPRTENVDFREVSAQVRDKLAELRPQLDELHIESTEIDNLQDYLVNDRFRLSVLGEFKRGKSTLINALLEHPDLMPTATLPCTSALTEIRHGEKLVFMESKKQGYPGTFEVKDATSFRDNVGHADKHYHCREEADQVAEKVPYWRVECPASFLETSSIALIDSPGLGEDYARDAITKREAKRADAAVLVFNIEQAASLEELKLIEEMGTHAENLFIVMNRADKVNRDEWPRIEEHVITKVKNHTGTDFSGRITFLSAKEAEDALKDGTESEWATAFAGFRDELTTHLSNRAGPIKTSMLRTRVQLFADQIDRQLSHEIELRQELLKEYSTLEVARTNMEGKRALARSDVKYAYRILKKSGGPVTEKLYTKFRAEAVPMAVEAMRSEMAEWTTETSFLKPKKLAAEIGDQARECFLQAINRWAEGSGAEVVSAGVADAIDEMVDGTQDLQAYLEEAGGLSADDYIAKLQARSLENAFGSGVEIDAAEVAMKNALAGALSLVLGYIIADIILYYILGVIAGFLNPWLLAAAVVASIPLALFGTDRVKNHIKKKIVSKIEEKMQEGDTLHEIRRGLTDAVDDVFGQLADGFKDSAQELLSEVEKQYQRTIVEMEKFLETLGGEPDAKRQELARVRQLASEARETLTAMRQCIQ